MLCSSGRVWLLCIRLILLFWIFLKNTRLSSANIYIVTIITCQYLTKLTLQFVFAQKFNFINLDNFRSLLQRSYILSTVKSWSIVVGWSRGGGAGFGVLFFSRRRIFWFPCHVVTSAGHVGLSRRLVIVLSVTVTRWGFSLQEFI